MVMELYKTKSFRRWLNHSKINMLDRADILSETLFKKPYSETYKFEKDYIIKQLAKTLN